jgi:hypothetical protein
MPGASRKIEPHDGAPQLGLEADDEHQEGHDGRRVEHPAGDEEVQLACQERAKPQRQNTQGHAERTRLPAPSQQQINRDGQNDEVHRALPPKGDHSVSERPPEPSLMNHLPAVPDIVLLSADWPVRALIRAQLLEEGFEVIATDAWPMTRRFLRPGSKPRLVIVDLQELPNPNDVLSGVSVLMKPNQVLILTAIGAVPPSEIGRLGFHVVKRPVAIADIIAVVVRLISSQASEQA